METGFPQSTNRFLKASIFQDQEIPLRFAGWEKRANEDVPARNGKAAISWKQRLKYQLRYSYPEWAVDEAGEKKLNKENKPFRNKYFDVKFPKGYSIVYHFQEGQLESGSLPLFECFCLVQPKPGEMLLISRSGEQQDTKWKIRKVSGDIRASKKESVEYEDDVSSIQIDDSELKPDDEVPF